MPNLYNEIEPWKHHHFLALCRKNFGVRAFMKLYNKNATNILAFWSTNFGIWALWNWPLDWACLSSNWPVKWRGITPLWRWSCLAGWAFLETATMGHIGLNLDKSRAVLPLEVRTTIAFALTRYEASTAEIATACVASWWSNLV